MDNSAGLARRRLRLRIRQHRRRADRVAAAHGKVRKLGSAHQPAGGGHAEAQQPRSKSSRARIPQNDSMDEMPINERGEILVRRYFPFDAEYSIMVRVRGNPAPGLPAPSWTCAWTGKRVKLFDAEIDTAEANQGTRSIRTAHAARRGRALHRSRVPVGIRQARKRWRRRTRRAPHQYPAPGERSCRWNMSASAGPYNPDGSGRHGEPQAHLHLPPKARRGGRRLRPPDSGHLSRGGLIAGP